MFVLDQSVHEPVIFFIIIQAFSWPKPLAKKIPELERENDKTIYCNLKLKLSNTLQADSK